MSDRVWKQVVLTNTIKYPSRWKTLWKYVICHKPITLTFSTWIYTEDLKDAYLDICEIK